MALKIFKKNTDESTPRFKLDILKKQIYKLVFRRADSESSDSSQPNGVPEKDTKGAVSLKREKLISNTLRTSVLILANVIIFIPVLILILNAFKEQPEFSEFPQSFLPHMLSGENFKSAARIADIPFGRAVFNSLFISLSVAFVETLTCAAAAYVLVTQRSGIIRILNVVIEFFLVFSGAGVITLRTLTVVGLGLYDTYAALIMPFTASALGVFLMRRSMQGVAECIYDSARLQGANHFRLFWHIYLPMSKPAGFTVAVFTFVESWRTSRELFFYSEGFRTLNSLILKNSQEAGLCAAVSLFILIPAVFVFVKGRKNIEITLRQAGLKQ